MKTLLTIPTIILLNFCVQAQVNWIKHESNPVVERDTVLVNLANDFFAISDNWVLKEGDVYKMWYTCGGFNYPTDDFNLRARICYCESEDGIVWNKSENNPVLDIDYAGGWDSLAVETATVIIDSDAPISSRYKMWYAGETESAGKYNIGYAFSSNGIDWIKHPDPVLEVGGDLEWDNGFLEGPSIIKDGATYKMWYAALDATFEGSESDGFVNVGYATSLDGITWEKHAENPVLTVSESDWDSIYVQDPHVIKEGGLYHLWYGGSAQYDNYGQEVGYASSADGIDWTKSTENPVLKRGDAEEWDANTASFPSVLIDDGQLKMWYTGKDVHPLPSESSDYYWEIGYALGDTLSLGISKENIRIDLYPNPTKSAVSIRSNLPIGAIQIYNLLGETVYEFNTQEAQLNVDLSQFSAGLYVVSIKGLSPIKLMKE